ncbi:regulatory protein TetR [Candidatus Protofrankia californiensis]|uniref:Regulatory protein TetR n=1 Tax=Candidatus Protofrankia californiensis TaxID=1839754 RepID=A0A1C3P2X1_9ACTN|nr:regulatory protein TetR [Candidatus Protofrankia californiensis]
MLRRRDRLRAETVRDIKAIALRHMADGGAAALSLRAIAREMGMTAGALYSYYDTRDDMVTALVTDVYTSVAQRLESVRAAVPADDPGGALLAVATAYREWAVTNPQEFQLLYGSPIPGYRFPAEGDASSAEQQACVVLLRLVETAWPALQARMSSPEAGMGMDADGYDWSDFTPPFAALARAAVPCLPPAAVALSLRIWGRLHGLLALEINGHLRPHVADPAKLYRAEVRELAAWLGFGDGPDAAGTAAVCAPSSARMAAMTGPGSSAR